MTLIRLVEYRICLGLNYSKSQIILIKIASSEIRIGGKTSL